MISKEHNKRQKKIKIKPYTFSHSSFSQIDISDKQNLSLYCYMSGESASAV